MNEPEQLVIAYWLLPAAPFRDFFCETIQHLATEYDAPVFQPHLTLAVGQDLPSEGEAKLAQLPRGPVELRVLEVSWTSKFTKTLFVRFGSSPRLMQLRDSLGRNEGNFDPHLSLLYRKLPEKDQATLASEIRLPFTLVNFDAVVTTRCRLPVETAAHIAAWKSGAARSLISEKVG